MATLLAVATLPLATRGARASDDSGPDGRGPSPDVLGCDSATGIWRTLTGENHDNLLATFGRATAAPGEVVPLTLSWEWRDWRPGAPLTVRVCIDVDATADGEASAPFEDLGANPAGVTVVHPTTEPSARVEARVEGGTELRPAVQVLVPIAVAASAPAGGEVCVRSAVLGDAADHRHSPPLFDISPTACVTVVAPPVVVTVTPPPPTPALPPEVAPVVVPAPPEVLAEKVLPPTGAPIEWLAVTGVALVVLGALVWSRGRRPGSPSAPG